MRTLLRITLELNLRTPMRLITESLLHLLFESFAFGLIDTAP